jgi:hypothetical protein
LKFKFKIEVEDEHKSKILRSQTAFTQQGGGKFLLGRLHWDLTW